MSTGPDRVVVELDRVVAMRDGVGLATDVYRPDDEQPHPVLVHRSPYAKALPTALLEPIAAVRAGYVVVMQESRGRMGSEGGFTPFHHEADDGYDTIEWAAGQPWSTGAVGTYGASGNGATAAQAITAAPPHLRCAALAHTGFDPHDGWVYADGALELGFLHGWVRRFAGTHLARLDVDPATRQHLAEALADWAERPDEVIRDLPLDTAFPAALAPFFHEWLAHPAADAYWAEVDAVARAHLVQVPVLHLTGWYDGFAKGHHAFQRALQGHPDPLVRDASRLVVGPWDHHSYLSPTMSSWSGQRSFGPAAASGPALNVPLLLDWFARWLHDDASVETGPPVRYFMMGGGGWQTAASWPPPTTAQVWHLTGADAHGAGSRPADLDGITTGGLVRDPDDLAGADTYRYDPLDPTPTVGGNHLGLEFASAGLRDQRPLVARSDVLLYVGPRLDGPVAVAGRPRLHLFAASTAPDTDLVVKVVDVEPDGFLANVGEGMVRARYREGPQEERFLTPGEVVEYEVVCWDVAHTFRPGHRIAVTIASADFPRRDRNPNVARPIASVARSEVQVAEQTVHRGGARPSRLVLPVLGGEG